MKYKIIEKKKFFITMSEYKEMERENILKIFQDVEAIHDKNEKINLDATCKRCPFKRICGKAEIYWKCGHWEESMGEDL